MNKISLIIAFLCGFLVGMGVASIIRPVEQTPALGNGITQGIVPSVASVSGVAVTSGTVATLAASSTACVSRVVSTASTSLMLTFAGKLTPTGALGSFQAASTTKEYDNAQYGCGQIAAFPFATGVVTVTVVTQQ